MLRHDLRRALLSPRTLFVALVYGVLLSLGATETWNDSAAYQFAFSYKTGFYILFHLCPIYLVVFKGSYSRRRDISS